jgi:hypothetical protein
VGDGVRVGIGVGVGVGVCVEVGLGLAVTVAVGDGVAARAANTGRSSGRNQARTPHTVTISRPSATVTKG